MNFRYTRHIRKRIRQRHFFPAQIEETLTRPDCTIPTYKGRYLAQKSFHGKILEVVYKEERERTILITAYWLELEGEN